MKSMVWTKCIGKRILGDNCHWLVMKQLSFFSAQKSMSSQILWCASGGSFNILIPTKLGKTELQGSNPGEATETMTESVESRPEFEWNIFPGFTTLQLCDKVTDLLSIFGETPETFTGRILFMSMFNDISCDRKDNKDECLRNAKVVYNTCKEVWYWTMVIYWSRFRKEVVFYGRE